MHGYGRLDQSKYRAAKTPRKAVADRFGLLGFSRVYTPTADKPDPKADDSYSEEETDRRMDATVRAMIGMRPKPHQPLSQKPKTRPASKGRVRKGKSRS